MGIFSNAKKYKEVKKLLKSSGKVFGVSVITYLGGHPDIAINADCKLTVNQMGIFIIGIGLAIGVFIPGERITNINLNVPAGQAMEISYFSDNGVPIKIMFKLKSDMAMIASCVAKLRAVYPQI